LFGREATLSQIFYFSAFANFLIRRRPETVKRHRVFVKAIESYGIIPIISKFKKKEIFCPNCKKSFFGHEEKETDVAIAVKILELCANDSSDIIVILSGDTDLAPAVETAKKLYPLKKFVFLFPPNRKNKRLAEIVSNNNTYTIGIKQLSNHILPDKLILSDGKELIRPDQW